MSLRKRKDQSEGYEEMQVKILRSNPTTGEDPYWQTYKVPMQTGESVSVLSLLQSIFENQDPSLAFIGPCEKGLCGICTVVVDGDPCLSCKTFVNSDITIEPLKGFKIIRDLVVDRKTRILHILSNSIT